MPDVTQTRGVPIMAESSGDSAALGCWDPLPQGPSPYGPLSTSSKTLTV